MILLYTFKYDRRVYIYHQMLRVPACSVLSCCVFLFPVMQMKMSQRAQCDSTLCVVCMQPKFTVMSSECKLNTWWRQTAFTLIIL